MAPTKPSTKPRAAPKATQAGKVDKSAKTRGKVSYSSYFKANDGMYRSFLAACKRGIKHGPDYGPNMAQFLGALLGSPGLSEDDLPAQWKSFAEAYPDRARRMRMDCEGFKTLDDEKVRVDPTVVTDDEDGDEEDEEDTNMKQKGSGKGKAKAKPKKKGKDKTKPKIPTLYNSLYFGNRHYYGGRPGPNAKIPFWLKKQSFPESCAESGDSEDDELEQTISGKIKTKPKKKSQASGKNQGKIASKSASQKVIDDNSNSEDEEEIGVEEVQGLQRAARTKKRNDAAFRRWAEADQDETAVNDEGDQIANSYGDDNLVDSEVVMKTQKISDATLDQELDDTNKLAEAQRDLPNQEDSIMDIFEGNAFHNIFGAATQPNHEVVPEDVDPGLIDPALNNLNEPDGFQEDASMEPEAEALIDEE
ncbi:hypothetical protein NM208_g4586 [Fusarium decemcellulare]|uniref:Uncharacterized protein n=2 Tax=Fusarium decemcellulare TaxID=57161 RepID=A0ACC1SK59_9HYPO|nr:hypothetical protein NM208_g6265 [Fusarium decemcellulare]KAJ3541493.1 hypothetical protein NM208_g4586 [Fusarium decemcellulare]